MRLRAAPSARSEAKRRRPGNLGKGPLVESFRMEEDRQDWGKC